MWKPLPDFELARLIDAAEALMTPAEEYAWSLIKVPPTKWAQHPEGDEGGGFWVVAVLGNRVIWYNDIEDGFNVSRYLIAGVIAEYWCGQSQLHSVVSSLQRELSKGFHSVE